MAVTYLRSRDSGATPPALGPCCCPPPAWGRDQRRRRTAGRADTAAGQGAVPPWGRAPAGRRRRRTAVARPGGARSLTLGGRAGHKIGRKSSSVGKGTNRFWLSSRRLLPFMLDPEVTLQFLLMTVGMSYVTGGSRPPIHVSSPFSVTGPSPSPCCLPRRLCHAPAWVLAARDLP